jgi:hypothetical protein
MTVLEFVVQSLPKPALREASIENGAKENPCRSISKDSSSFGNMADRMSKTKPPRALRVKFPRGSMLGEPGNAKRQRRIILDGLDALKTMTEPGAVIELPYRWKQMDISNIKSTPLKREEKP